MQYTPELLNALCRTKFSAFAERAFRIIEPGTPFEWGFHVDAISEHLESAFYGDIKRLVINIPPRHLKTYLVAKSFPAWALGKIPSKKFICTSFKSELATEMATDCRRIMHDDWYKSCFPETRIERGEDKAHNFRTTQRGMYYSAPIFSVMGKGADFVLIDDPLNPMEAASDTMRTSTNNVIRSTLFSRLNDQRTGVMILIMQRLHEDDPSGSLLAQGGWTHLKIPVEAKTFIYIQIKDKSWNMEQGDLLSPERFSRPILDELRNNLGEYNYAGQYLQEPVPIGGGEFREQWVQYYAPGGIKPTEMNVVILVDPSGGEELNKKKKKTSDWTAMMVVGLAPDNNYYLLDAVRDRLNPTERVNTLFLLHRKWNDLCGKPPKVGYEKYGMMTDTHYIRDKQKVDAYNFALIELGGRVQKEERIRQLIPDLQNGRWYFPQTLMYVDNEGRHFDLVKELVYSEMPTFPRARFDDMLDALARVYEPELFLSFPKAKSTMVTTAYDSFRDNHDQGWVGY